MPKRFVEFISPSHRSKSHRNEHTTPENHVLNCYKHKMCWDRLKPPYENSSVMFSFYLLATLTHGLLLFAVPVSCFLLFSRLRSSSTSMSSAFLPVCVYIYLMLWCININFFCLLCGRKRFVWRQIHTNLMANIIFATTQHCFDFGALI